MSSSSAENNENGYSVFKTSGTYFEGCFFVYLPRSVSPHDRSPGVLRATNPAEEGTAQATCLYHRRRTIHRVPGREPLPQTRPGGYPPTLAVGPTSSDVSGYQSDVHQWGL